ncbi:MAG: hypothetical protein ACREJU_15050 [Nitrospiraceae bacterium]
MRNLVVVGIAMAILSFGVSAMAADNDQASFFAFSKLTQESTLQAMTDNQLTAVEGARDVCVVCLNIASVYQNNSLLQRNRGGFFFDDQSNRARQHNHSRINQSIN